MSARTARGPWQALVEFSTLAPEAPTAETETGMPRTARWAGTIGLEGTMTGDGRLIEPEALTWVVGEASDNGTRRRIPLRDVVQDVGAHDGASVVGSIDKIERREGGIIHAEGDFDLSTEEGQAAFRAVRDGRRAGISMDLDSVSFEVRVAAEVIEAMDDMMEALFEGEEGETPERETAEDGRVIVGKMDADEEVMVTTSARIRAATIVAIPAFDEAEISVTETSYDEPSGEEAEAAESSPEPAENSGKRNDLTASGAPVHPPREWFDAPQLTGPTPLVVTDDGRVYGHLATWDVCHTASPAGPGVCVQAPNSATGYSRFHTGSVQTSEGAVISTGRITMSGQHASPKLNASAAAAHYDNSATAVADVRAYEDAYGIVLAGALRPTATPQQVRELRGSPLSGDWRAVDGNLELHAALAVNVPGFPIPRPQGLVASGQLTSLVAAGMLAPVEEAPDSGLSDSDLRYLRSLADRERRMQRDELASRVLAVKAKKARDRVESFVARRRIEE